MYQKIRRYFLEGLWNFPLSRERGRRRLLFKSLRIATLSLRDFFQDECILHASALTYYTVMSTVPVLAMSFAIARGFGFQEFLRDRILVYFEQNHEILLHVLTIAENMIREAKGGAIAGIGIAVLFWSVTQLLSNLESSMNQIWKVKKLRSWRRIFTDYFALMLIAPCLFFISTSVSVFFIKVVDAGIEALHLSPLIEKPLLLIVKLSPYCLFWFLFTFVYLFMPNKKVQFSSAFLGGIVGGTIYLIVQWAYIFFQGAFNRYGVIYGSFAALPLFLIWVHTSWMLLLLGAEVSCAHQTLDRHEFEDKSKRVSVGYKRLLSLWVVHLAVAKYMTDEPYLTRESLTVRYQIPHSLANPIVDDLVEGGLLLDTGHGLIPARPGHEIRISDVLQALEAKGDSDFPFIEAGALAPFEKALTSFREEIEKSPENKRLYPL